MNNLKETCFYCGRLATSVEHVPPRSFFPKHKDLPPAIDTFRKNLITVPACNDHNSRCSHDDEIASLIVRLPREANSIGQHDFIKKGIRAIKRKKGIDVRLFKNVDVIKTPNSKELPVMEFDAECLNRVMDRIAHGLYFHDFKRRWECELNIISDGPIMPDLSQNPLQENIRRLDLLFRHVERNGENPSIFWYQWYLEEEGNESYILRMCFYEGWKFIVIPP